MIKAKCLRNVEPTQDSSRKSNGEDRWAFATKQPWARKKAHKTKGGKITRYRRLPKSKHSGRRAR